MEPEYLLDSNVVIGFLAGNIPASGMAAVSRMVERQARLPVITQIEVLRFNDTPENGQVLAGFKNIANLSLLNPWDITH